MIIKMRTIAVVATGLVVMVALAACSGLKTLDVVGQQSITSFEDVLKAIPEKVQTDIVNAGWALSLHDVMLELDAEPFLNAGLDPEKLPDNYAFYEGDTMGGMGSKMLMVGKRLGNDKITYDGSPTALAAYEQIVSKYRDSINYHTSLDHYGVKLGDDNMFEWAKDMNLNGYDNSNQDKDIVFVLNPEPLMSAGVDPEKVEGWAYAQVPIEENGKTEQVWKLLKPFNLK